MGDRLPSHVEALPRSLRPPSTTHRQLTELSKDSDIAHGRAERVVTQIDFAAWVADHLESHPAENVRPDSLQKPSSVPLGEGKVASHSASAQKPPVVQAERAVSERKMQKSSFHGLSRALLQLTAHRSHCRGHLFHLLQLSLRLEALTVNGERSMSWTLIHLTQLLWSDWLGKMQEIDRQPFMIRTCA